MVRKDRTRETYKKARPIVRKGNAVVRADKKHHNNKLMPIRLRERSLHSPTTMAT